MTITEISVSAAPDNRWEVREGTPRVVRLRTVEPRDIPFLYRLATEGETAGRWRYRGATPDPQAFAAQLWQDVLAQFVVERVADGGPVGLVCAYNANLRDGYVYAAGVCDAPFLNTGFGAEALLLLADHLFAHWNFRKIYFESAAFNFAQFASGAAEYFVEEARLADHTFHDGRYWDLVIGSLTRAGLQEVHARRDLRRRRTGVDDGLMDIDRFCAALADALELDRGCVQPDHRLIEDLGVDSLGALIVQDLMERDAGITEFDLSAGLGTVRQAYTLYLTAASVPPPLSSAPLTALRTI
jgi:RimJ/RimL family protein N-acetyltransferase